MGRNSFLDPNKNYSPQWQGIAQSSAAGANFLADLNTIVLRNTRFSIKIRTILFFHEADHAQDYLEHPYKQEEESLVQYLDREIYTHKFEDELFSQVGGAPYARFLAKKVAKIRAGVKRSSGTTFQIPDRGPYDKELASIFGEPESEEEKALLQTHLWIHAVLEWIKQDYEGNQDKERDFFTAVYK